MYKYISRPPIRIFVFRRAVAYCTIIEYPSTTIFSGIHYKINLIIRSICSNIMSHFIIKSLNIPINIQSIKSQIINSIYKYSFSRVINTGLFRWSFQIPYIKLIFCLFKRWRIKKHSKHFLHVFDKIFHFFFCVSLR